MASSMSPLSLAYMIEISFVLNLAYHELQTFRLRDQIRKRAKDIRNSFRGMWDDTHNELVNPEWSFLKGFHKGEDKEAWEGKWRRYFYMKFIRDCADRWIVRGFMAIDIVILIACTLSANVSVSLFGDSFGTAEVLWLCGFILLLLTIIVPPIFMLLIRLCKQYAFGCIDEDPFSDEDVAIAHKGRMNELEQKVLNKATHMSDLLNAVG